MKTCPFCAETDLQDLAVVCKHCQRDLPPVGRTDATAAPHAPSASSGRGIWYVVASLVVLAWLAATFSSVSRQESSTNETHALLIAEGSNAQANRLGIIVRSTGATCTNSYAPFFQGEQQATGEVFWDVKCATGGEYAVSIKLDGSTRVLECAVLRATTGLSCFQPLK